LMLIQSPRARTRQLFGENRGRPTVAKGKPIRNIILRVPGVRVYVRILICLGACVFYSCPDVAYAHVLLMARLIY
jgi:hypothetical protein